LQAELSQLDEKRKKLRPLHTNALREKKELKEQYEDVKQETTVVKEKYVSFENH